MEKSSQVTSQILEVFAQKFPYFHSIWQNLPNQNQNEIFACIQQIIEQTYPPQPVAPMNLNPGLQNLSSKALQRKSETDYSLFSPDFSLNDIQYEMPFSDKEAHSIIYYTTQNSPNVCTRRYSHSRTLPENDYASPFQRSSPNSNPRINLLDLPKDCLNYLLRFIIKSENVFKNLVVLRLTCKQFRELVIVSPFWQQKIPITQLEYYQFNCQRFGWNIPRSIHIVFMGWFDKGKELLTLSPNISQLKLDGKHIKDNHMQYLPQIITHLDLSGCYNLTDEGLNLIPCGNLTHLILPWSRGITDRGVNSILYRSLPNLTIRFEKTISAIYWATFFAYEITFSLLMEKTKGIYDINELNGVHGLTCLYLAAGKGLNKMVALLLHYGADPNKPTFDNKVPLMPSSYNGHFDIVISLLSNRADVTKRDNHGNKALDLALQMGHQQIAQYLQCAERFIFQGS